MATAPFMSAALHIIIMVVDGIAAAAATISHALAHTDTTAT
ncbi:MAG: hypothetical protein P8P36_06695 [Akkermansiaceae bacterium]|nr:hypothetical protein [Akkermansiaceae bacterium]